LIDAPCLQRAGADVQQNVVFGVGHRAGVSLVQLLRPLDRTGHFTWILKRTNARAALP
jgi:isopropylmalate/homocitrate/citramalate synthase